MPTINQERTAQKVKESLQDNKNISGGELLKQVGYGGNIQRYPKRVFDSKGFQEAMGKLGFSLEAADLAVTKILHTGKEENRLRASDQIYKRLGGYSPEKRINIEVIITAEERALAKEALDTIE